MGRSIATDVMRILFVWLVLFPVVVTCSEKIHAEESKPEEVPNRYGMATTFGYSYDTRDDRSFALITGFVLFDYEKVWHHPAPDPLRFKVEFSAGTTMHPDSRFMASAGIFAVYYLERFAVGYFRPYIEGGIGGIYTDFREPGQGLRLNFNPQAGLGTEFAIGSDHSFFTALRTHHLSNAGLDTHNRGFNSIVVMLGHFF